MKDRKLQKLSSRANFDACSIGMEGREVKKSTPGDNIGVFRSR